MSDRCASYTSLEAPGTVKDMSLCAFGNAWENIFFTRFVKSVYLFTGMK